MYSGYDVMTISDVLAACEYCNVYYSYNYVNH